MARHRDVPPSVSVSHPLPRSYFHSLPATPEESPIASLEYCCHPPAGLSHHHVPSFMQPPGVEHSFDSITLGSEPPRVLTVPMGHTASSLAQRTRPSFFWPCLTSSAPLSAPRASRIPNRLWAPLMHDHVSPLCVPPPDGSASCLLHVAHTSSSFKTPLSSPFLLSVFPMEAFPEALQPLP